MGDLLRVGLPSGSRRRIATAAVLAGLLVVAAVLCWVHDMGAGHAAFHVPCAPLLALMVAGVLLPLLGGAGWLVPLPAAAFAAASPHLPDPPPKRRARS